jgi:hypothetical protein
MFRDEEIAEGKKDAGVDMANGKKMRKLSHYSENYREGYLSEYKKAEKPENKK